MIDAKELRIGNKVFRNGIVVTCDFMSIPDCYKSPEEYGPIPLTPEWLGRFGFDWDENTGLWVKEFGDDLFDIFFFVEGDDFSISISTFDIRASNDYHYLTPHGNRSKYVHQLQNLIHALTGKELETI